MTKYCLFNRMNDWEFVHVEVSCSTGRRYAGKMTWAFMHVTGLSRASDVSERSGQVPW